jgi:3-oxoacyl-[acyl-carrier protein] reductase
MGALKDQVALVTGSSRGIGAAIARLFAHQGARVVLHGRDEQAMSAVQADIERSGGRATSIRADISKLAEIEAMRGEIEKRLGPVDIRGQRGRQLL